MNLDTIQIKKSEEKFFIGHILDMECIILDYQMDSYNFLGSEFKEEGVTSTEEMHIME